MCLHTLQKVALVAEEDIIVYKMLDPSSFRFNTFFSLIQQFEYEIGLVYETTMTIVADGRHANWEASRWYNGLTEKQKVQDVIIIQEGFHAFITKGAVPQENIIDGKLVKCIIPKGSQYYINEHVGLIVSNAIKLIERDTF